MAVVEFQTDVVESSLSDLAAAELSQLREQLLTDFFCFDVKSAAAINTDCSLPLCKHERFEPLLSAVIANGVPVCLAGEGAVSLWAISLSSDTATERVAMGAFLTDLAPLRTADVIEVLGCTNSQAEDFIRAQSIWPHRGLDSLFKTLGANRGYQQRALEQVDENNQLASSVAQSYEELTLLHDLSGQLRLDLDPIVLCQGVLESLCNCVPAMTLAAVWGTDDSQSISQVGERLPELLIWQTYKEFKGALDGQPLVVNNNIAQPWRPRDMIAVKICDGGRAIGGVFAIGRNCPEEFGTNEANVMQSVAGVFGGFLANQRLYLEARNLFQDAIRAFSSAIDAKDPYTCGHSSRVAVMSQVLAQQLGLSDEDVEVIYLSGLLHDVGKIGTSETVLRKPGRLTDEEFEHIKQHPEMGYRILANIRQFEAFLPGVRFHHEAWDGTGYPVGLIGPAIPRQAQIIAVADSIDAMASDRPYRRGMPLENVEAILMGGRGTQWAADVVDAYFACSDSLWQAVKALS